MTPYALRELLLFIALAVGTFVGPLENSLTRYGAANILGISRLRAWDCGSDCGLAALRSR
jgi:hypothetical protein